MVDWNRLQLQDLLMDLSLEIMPLHYTMVITPTF